MIRELYLFAIGSDVYRYVSGDTAIEHDGETWEPETIGRSEITQGAEINRAGISVRLPRDNPVAGIYLTDTPDVVGSVTVLRDQGDVLVWWKGRIAATRATDSVVTLECESVFTSMRRTGARARYQIQCRHALYGTSCGVDRADYATVGAVVSADQTTLTVDGAESQPDGYWVGGMVELDGVLRFVVGHDGQTLRLWRPLPGAEADAEVTLYPGCDRSLAMCDQRFSNAVNHGGFPWLPNSNPFRFINIF